MVSKILISIFEDLEKDLFKVIDKNTFYEGIEENPELVNGFLTKYIDLKQGCNAQIKDLNTTLKDKTVVVTGGSSGIGKQTAILCKILGANVYVCDLKDPEIKGVNLACQRN